MKFTSFSSSSLVLLACATGAHALDTYNGSQVSIAAVTVGTATLTNVTAGVASIVTRPSGSAPNGAVDYYDPVSGDLTVQSVQVGATVYNNAVVTLGPSVSIGGATGVDTYSGGQLSIPAVQVGGTVYTGVTVNVTPSNISGLGGGMPAATQDSYNISTGVLTVPTVVAFGHVYTNVTLKNVTLANVAGVQGHHSAGTGVMMTALNSNQTTNTAGAAGTWAAYYGGGFPTLAGGTGGGYADQAVNPSYEYAYVQDTLANLEFVPNGGAAYTYSGVGVTHGSDQTVTTVGFNTLSFSVAVNPEWLSTAGGANFVVLISGYVPGVANANCTPQVAAVVKATSANATAYTVPLSAFDTVHTNCSDSSLTAAQILGAPITQIDFQAAGQGAAITASGLTSNSNLTVPLASQNTLYPTTINLVGGVSFVANSGKPPTTTGVMSTGFNSDQTTTTAGANGTWAVYFGGADPTLAGGSGGGYADQAVNPSYEYVFVQDTLANLQAVPPGGGNPYTYQGVGVKPGSDQTVSTSGFNNLSFTAAVNQEWLSTAGGANFVVLISGYIQGVSSSTCNPQAAAVVTATSTNATAYTVPLTAFTKITQNCGDGSITPAQVLAAPIVGIDFQADGQGAAITASGLTSNSNLTVQSAQNPGQYPTTVNVVGEISFVK